LSGKASSKAQNALPRTIHTDSTALEGLTELRPLGEFEPHMPDPADTSFADAM